MTIGYIYWKDRKKQSIENNIQLAPIQMESALEEVEAELSFIKQVREITEAELRDIKRILPSPQMVEKAREELEDVKYIFAMPYTVGILENLSKRGAGKVKTSEEIERGIEASRKEEKELKEEVDRILG